MIELVALHKHWCIADSVRVVIGAPIQSKEKDEEFIKQFGTDFVTLGKFASMFSRLSVWYALLYIVL